jgi:hypothetical protein
MPEAIPTSTMNSVLDSAAINDVFFGPTMRDLDSCNSYAINDEYKDHKVSRKTSASDMSRNLCEDMSPLQMRGLLKTIARCS